MAKFDWLAKTRICLTMLKCVGLWPKKGTDYGLNLYTLHAFVVIGLLVFADVIFETISLYFVRDVETLASSLFILPAKAVVILKVCIFIRNKDILQQLVEELSSDSFQPVDQIQKNLLVENFAQWRTIFYATGIGAGGSLVFFEVTPALDDSPIAERNLLTPAWYPFNSKVSPFFQFAYFHQAMSLNFCCITNSFADLFVAALNMYIGCQYDLLCNNFKRLKSQDTKKLVQCIKHHKKILRFAENCNRITNPIIFAQFCQSGIVIGISLYQITVLPFGSLQFFGLLCFELAMLVEIFMYCWFGNEIELKSSNVVYSAFESDWYTWDIKTQKILLFFMLNASKPLKVSAFGLFYLSNETFVSILRSSWSFFTLLAQFSD